MRLVIVFVIIVAAFNFRHVVRSQMNNLLTKLQAQSIDAILYWNWVTLQAFDNDYDTLLDIIPNQLGPTTTLRAFAIIHSAIYESMVTFNQAFKPLFKPQNLPDILHVHKDSAINAAILEATYQILYVLYPEQRTIFDEIRQQYLSQLETNGNKQAGITMGIFVGKFVTTMISVIRQSDNRPINTTYVPSISPRFCPVEINEDFLGGNSTEVKLVESKTDTVRTSEQIEIGICKIDDILSKIDFPSCFYNQTVMSDAGIPT